MKTDWKWFAMLMMTVVIVALLQRSCRREEDVVQVTTVTRTDTLRVCDTIFFPAPYLVTYPVTMPADIDTAAVLADYFSRKSYAIPYEDTAVKAVTDRTVRHELQRTDRVGDTFEVVTLSVGKVVHRVTMPLRTGTVVGYLDDAVDDGVAEVHVGIRHIQFGTQHHRAFDSLRRVHLLKQT